MIEIPLIKFPCAWLIFTCHLQKELRFYVPLIIVFQEKAICQQQQNKLIFHINTQNGAFHRELAKYLAKNLKSKDMETQGNQQHLSYPFPTNVIRCNKGVKNQSNLVTQRNKYFGIYVTKWQM